MNVIYLRIAGKMSNAKFLKITEFLENRYSANTSFILSFTVWRHKSLPIQK